jgi:hypothetical protein
MAFTFKSLWDNHPSISDNEEYPCRKKDGTPTYANQCSIKMGIALRKGGVDMKRFKIAACSLHAVSECHFTWSEGLAQHIRFNEQKQFGKVEIKKGVTAFDYSTRRGLVFFKDFWYRQGEKKYPTGDHIDLWDKDQMCSGDPSYFEESKEVWFWDLA